MASGIAYITSPLSRYNQRNEKNKIKTIIPTSISVFHCSCPKTVSCSRTTSYRSSLTGFLTSLPLRVVYEGWSLDSAMCDEGCTSPAGISSAAEGLKWYSRGELSICGLAGNVDPACVLSSSGSVCCVMFP